MGQAWSDNQNMLHSISVMENSNPIQCTIVDRDNSDSEEYFSSLSSPERDELLLRASSTNITSDEQIDQLNPILSTFQDDASTGSTGIGLNLCTNKCISDSTLDDANRTDFPLSNNLQNIHVKEILEMTEEKKDSDDDRKRLSLQVEALQQKIEILLQEKETRLANEIFIQEQCPITSSEESVAQDELQEEHSLCVLAEWQHATLDATDDRLQEDKEFEEFCERRTKDMEIMFQEQRQQFEVYCEKRIKELDSRQDSITKKEVHLFNQKLSQFQNQGFSGGLNHFQEQLQSAQSTINQLNISLINLESENRELTRRDYEHKQIICCKYKEAKKLTEEIQQKSKEIHDKSKEVHFQKLENLEKSKVIKNSKDIVKKLQTALKDYSNYIHGEAERFKIRDKIQKMKTQISLQINDATKSRLMEELDLLESRLKSLDISNVALIQINDSETKDELLDFSNSTSASSAFDKFLTNTERRFNRFQSKGTQTDCTLNVSWQIMERENAVNDQLWWLREKKTALERKEATLNSKEKELNNLEDFLKNEKAKLVTAQALKDFKPNGILSTYNNRNTSTGNASYVPPTHHSAMDLTRAPGVGDPISYYNSNKNRNNKYKYKSGSTVTSPRYPRDETFSSCYDYDQKNVKSMSVNVYQGASSSSTTNKRYSKSLRSSPGEDEVQTGSDRPPEAGRLSERPKNENRYTKHHNNGSLSARSSKRYL